jgi:hypothetical protein
MNFVRGRREVKGPRLGRATSSDFAIMRWSPTAIGSLPVGRRTFTDYQNGAATVVMLTGLYSRYGESLHGHPLHPRQYLK